MAVNASTGSWLRNRLGYSIDSKVPKAIQALGKRPSPQSVGNAIEIVRTSKVKTPAQKKNLYSLILADILEYVKSNNYAYWDHYTNTYTNIAFEHENMIRQALRGAEGIVPHIKWDTYIINGNDKTYIYNHKGIMFYAILFNSIPIINELLLGERDVINAPINQLGDTPIYFASSKNKLEIVQKFLAEGVTIHDDTPLRNAIKNKNTKMVTLLLHTGVADKQNSYLVNAMDTDNIKMVNLFIANGADINIRDTMGRTLLLLAAGLNDLDMVRELLTKGANVNVHDLAERTPLLQAVSNNNLDMVREFLTRGANVNVHDILERTPLLLATNNNNLEIVRKLLAKGANVNVQDKKMGVTPLLLATEKNNLDMVELLLAKWARVNVQDKEGKTPLIWASYNNNLDMVRKFLTRGAEINVQSIRGNTPLLLATSKNNIDMIREFLAKGANVNVQDKAGYTPLLNAAMFENTEIVYEFLTTVDPADPTLGHPSVIDNLDEFSKEVQDIINIYYKPILKKWDGMDVHGFDQVFDATIIRRNRHFERSLQMDISICPVCGSYTDHTDPEGCNFMTHDCTTIPSYNRALFEKYSYDNYGKRMVEWCTLCGRICNGHHRHYALANASAPKADLSTGIKRDGGYDAWTHDCRKLDYPGGSIPEKIMRLHVYRETIKALQDEGAIGTLSYQEAMDRIIIATWNAPINPSPKLVADTQRELANKKFDLSSDLINSVTIPDKNTFDETLKQTLTTYPFPDVPWPNAGKKEFEPIVHQDKDDDMDLDTLPNVIQFMHQQPDGSVYDHTGGLYSIQNLFIGNNNDTNVNERKSSEMSLASRNQLWNVENNKIFGYCYMCSFNRSSTECNCKSQLYPQELQMALDKSIDLTDARKAQYQKILNQYKRIFNKVFASDEEKKKEKTHYLKNARALAESPRIFLDAIAKRNIELVHELLAMGANVNVQYIEGNTPLLLASYHNNLEMVQFLLANGAEVNIQSNVGWTPLLLATEKNNLEMVREFLAKDANVNVQDKEGVTPLLLATEKNNLEMVHDLLAKGADVNVQDKEGKTPLLMAAEKNNLDIIHELLKTMDRASALLVLQKELDRIPQTTLSPAKKQELIDAYTSIRASNTAAKTPANNAARAPVSAASAANNATTAAAFAANNATTAAAFAANNAARVPASAANNAVRAPASASNNAARAPASAANNATTAAAFAANNAARVSASAANNATTAAAFAANNAVRNARNNTVRATASTPNNAPPQNEALPAGWDMARDADGKAYYYNIYTRESTWDIPTTPAIKPSTNAGVMTQNLRSRKEFVQQGGKMINATKITTTACANNSCNGSTCSIPSQPKTRKNNRKHRKSSRKLRR